MATILKTIPFDAELLPLVSDFNCAAEEPPKLWEEEINEWIRMEPVAEDGALFWMEKGTQVWLYTNEEDETVGYGSLCESRWPDPAIVEKRTKIKRVPISLIPAVGLDRRFQGGPEGAAQDERYSTKILRHLLQEACKHSNRQPFLGLYVHPQNERAIRLYRREHFEDFSQSFWHEEAGVEYLSMILKLMKFSSQKEE